MRQQNASLFLERVGQDSWLVDLEGEPDLICIYGPYINQRIRREVYGDLPNDQSVLHATPTTHHDAHWHHGGGYARISSSEVKKALSLMGEVKDDCIFLMRPELKMREEEDGRLIWQNNTVYFVNNKGARLLNLLGNRIRVGDIKMLCEKHGISNRAAMEFLRRLVVFGLYRSI
ncbi:hypothetical protein M1O20_05815 [Dehalococcoidia bacterium]|nr:hypothetical protein [Dehalococcoidia bacterium]